MKAIILAGGKGSRLRPITCNKPKPLCNIAGASVLSYIIELLKKNQIYDYAVTVQYLADMITNQFGDGKKLDVNIKYYTETTPLGTAGGAKNCEDFIDEDFLVISGDGICDFDLQSAISFHKQKNAAVTIILKKVTNPSEFGVVLCDEQNKVIRFIEKPSIERAYSDLANTGIYIIDRSVLDFIPENTFYDFAKDLFPSLMKSGKSIYAYEATGYWCDIGNISQYLSCSFDVISGEVRTFYDTAKQNAYINANSFVPESAIVQGPVYIGKNVTIEPGAKIMPYSIIEDNCVIKKGASIKRSIISSGSFIGESCELRGSIIMENVKLDSRVRAFEGSVIGQDCVVLNDCLIAPGVKIWPQKNITGGKNVTENIVWSSGYKNLFSDEGICGRSGVDMSAAMCMRLGQAMCVLSDDIIVCNNSSSSKLMYEAFVCGLISGGVNVSVIENCFESAFRYATLSGKYDYGVFFDAKDNKVSIKICESDGMDISRDNERKLESAFLDEQAVQKQDVVYSTTLIGGTMKNYMSMVLKHMGNLSKMCVSLECSCQSQYDCAKQLIEKKGGIVDEASETKLYLLYEKGFSITDGKAVLAYPKSLAALYMATTDQHTYVPHDAPYAIDIIAADMKRSIERVYVNDADTRIGYQKSMYMFDNLSGALSLLSYMQEKSLSLEDICNMLPVFETKELFFHSQAPKSSVLKALIDSHSYKKELGDGVRLIFDKESVRVTPSKDKDGFYILSEAANMEAAAQLCSDIIDKIKLLK